MSDFLNWPDVDPRFRVDLYLKAGCWYATIYDHADHGHDVAYAKCSAPTLERTLVHVERYLLAGLGQGWNRGLGGQVVQ